MLRSSIFMYSNHEKTTLNAIHEDLEMRPMPSQKNYKRSFRTLPHQKDAVKAITPDIDLLKVVKEYIYLPSTKEVIP